MEWTVFCELDFVRRGDQSVTGDTGLGAVRLGDTAVDDEQSAACLDRRVAVLDRYVSVDNMTARRVKSELTQDGFAEFGLVVMLIIRVHVLLLQRLVVDKVALEGGHAILAE